MKEDSLDVGWVTRVGVGFYCTLYSDARLTSALAYRLSGYCLVRRLRLTVDCTYVQHGYACYPILWTTRFSFTPASAAAPTTSHLDCNTCSGN